MRIRVLSLILLVAAGCQVQTDGSAEEPEPAPPPINAVEAQTELPVAGGNVSTEKATSNAPEDPALAALSPNRRREYDRGYRDCLRGNYNYDPDRQGEFYRIGCMAAENVKAGNEP